MNEKRKRIMVVVATCILIALAMPSSYITKGAEINILEVVPGYEFIPMDTTFSINVYCKTAQPIKAYEFKMSFDPTKLQAVSVSEGDFFLGYATFFMPGTINNTAGTIVNIYDLIMGLGNISTPGVFVTVTFRTLNSTGVSDITIYDEGICNETMYVPYQKKNGKIQIYSGCQPWDVSEDGVIDLLDISAVIAYYGSTCRQGSERWDVKANGICDLGDLGTVISHYGEMY
jgi:hypothetical protein